jgi:hypothetical protein
MAHNVRHRAAQVGSIKMEPRGHLSATITLHVFQGAAVVAHSDNCRGKIRTVITHV